MDDKSVNYDQKRYEEIKDEVGKFLSKIGYQVFKEDKATKKITEWLVRVARLVFSVAHHRLATDPVHPDLGLERRQHA